MGIESNAWTCCDASHLPDRHVLSAKNDGARIDKFGHRSRLAAMCMILLRLLTNVALRAT